MRERVIETYLFSEVKKLGGMCIKQEPRYNVGIPDRLVVYKGLVVFVEVKAPGKHPTEKQLKYHNRLKECGMGVAVVDSKPTVDEFISKLRKVE